LLLRLEKLSLASAKLTLRLEIRSRHWLLPRHRVWLLSTLHLHGMVVSVSPEIVLVVLVLEIRVEMTTVGRSRGIIGEELRSALSLEVVL